MPNHRFSRAVDVWTCCKCGSDHPRRTTWCKNPIGPIRVGINIYGIGGSIEAGGRTICNHRRCLDCKASWRQ